MSDDFASQKACESQKVYVWQLAMGCAWLWLLSFGGVLCERVLVDRLLLLRGGCWFECVRVVGSLMVGLCLRDGGELCRKGGVVLCRC